MPIVTPYQASFASGYLSPKLQGRIDLEQYQAGAADITNWSVHPQGPLQRRNGTEFIDNFIDNYPDGVDENNYRKNIRFVPFLYSLDQSILLVFTYGNIYFYSQGGVVMKDGKRFTLPWFQGHTKTPPYYSFAQQDNILIVCGPSFPPMQLVCRGWTTWEVKRIEFIKQPPIWGPPQPDTTSQLDHPEGWWSNTYGWNWPLHCAFFDQRLVFAGNERQPTGVWMSRTGRLEDFTTETIITAGDTTDIEVADTDSVQYTIASNDASPITWMLPFSILAIGTQTAEYKCAASNLNEAITPNNVRITKQTQYGAATIPAKMIGTDAAFVSRNRKGLLIYAFNYLTDSWDATNATLFADDLCDVGIKDIAVQTMPDSNIWVVLDDGRLAKYSYDKKQKISCWSVYKLQDAKVLNVVVMPSRSHDEVWLYVRREVGDAEFLYVERFAPETYNVYRPEEARCLDSYLAYEGEPANYFEGLDHLDGQSVKALVDGKEYGPFLVRDGAVRIPIAGSYVIIGVPFKSNFVSMEVHDNQNLTVGNERSLYRVDVWLNHAAGLDVGLIPGYITDYESYRPKFEHLVDTKELYSGVRRSNVRCNAEHGVRINLVTTSALPATILGIKAYMEVN